MYSGAQWTQSKQKALGVSSDEARAKARAYFEKAAVISSPTYYQMLSERSLYQQKSEEAIAAAQRAIALDPERFVGVTEAMSWALTLKRQATGRQGFSRRYAACRSDVWNLALFHRQACRVLHGPVRRGRRAARLKARSQDAALQSYWDFSADYDRLAAAFVHLRASLFFSRSSADADAVKEKLKPLMADADDAEFTGLHAISGFAFQEFCRHRSACSKACARRAIPDLP